MTHAPVVVTEDEMVMVNVLPLVSEVGEIPSRGVVASTPR
jgi:hypothetical protein